MASFTENDKHFIGVWRSVHANGGDREEVARKFGLQDGNSASSYASQIRRKLRGAGSTHVGDLLPTFKKGRASGPSVSLDEIEALL
jgi:hypothetical protein